MRKRVAKQPTCGGDAGLHSLSAPGGQGKGWRGSPRGPWPLRTPLHAWSFGGSKGVSVVKTVLWSSFFGSFLIISFSTFHVLCLSFETPLRSLFSWARNLQDVALILFFGYQTSCWSWSTQILLSCREV